MVGSIFVTLHSGFQMKCKISTLILQKIKIYKQIGPFMKGPHYPDFLWYPQARFKQDTCSLNESDHQKLSTSHLKKTATFCVISKWGVKRICLLLYIKKEQVKDFILSSLFLEKNHYSPLYFNKMNLILQNQFLKWKKKYVGFSVLKSF